MAINDSTGSYSYFTDGNGNITDLTNAYGNVVSHQEYDPFGNVVASTGTFQQSYGWSSKENDGNGLTYYLYRFYNPSLGRWVNRDPIEEEGGVNINNSISNNPINFIDLFGLCYEEPDSQQFLRPSDSKDVPGWKLQGYNFGKTYSNNYITILYSLKNVDWQAKIYVHCICKCVTYGLSGTKQFVIDEIPLTTEIVYADPTAVPTNYAKSVTFKSIANGAGKVLASLFKKSLPSGSDSNQSFLTEQQINEIHNDIYLRKPSQPSDGVWVGQSPCKGLKK